MDEADHLARMMREQRKEPEREEPKDLGVVASYVVNLRRRPERWRTFVEAALAAGVAWAPLAERARFDAVDGAAVVVSATSALREVCFYLFGAEALGISLSLSLCLCLSLFLSLSLSLSLSLPIPLSPPLPLPLSLPILIPLPLPLPLPPHHHHPQHTRTHAQRSAL